MPHPSPHQWLLMKLGEAQQVLGAMGAQFYGMQLRMAELSSRLAEGALRLAVLGQFKRGKSTLLNALLGESILPAGVLPLTTIPTSLHYGPHRCVRVTFVDGRYEEQVGSEEDIARILERYVTERENPANRLGVIGVEMEHPAAFLSKGVSIIDTPGIGSTVLHNTRTARQVLPACDAALFVLSPDPPITEVEVEFLKAVKDAAARVIFVLSKADLLEVSHRHELLEFLNQVLCTHVGFVDPGPMFVVSASQALAAHRHSDPALRAQSGIDDLERYLTEFLVADKPRVLQQAIRAKAGRVLAEAMFTLDLHRKALDLPRRELQRRWDRLQDGLSKTEENLTYFRDRLGGDRQRLLAELDEQAEKLGQKLRERLFASARRVRDDAVPPIGFRPLADRIKLALGKEVDQAIADMKDEMLGTVTARVAAVQDLHSRQLGEVIERIRRTAADLFEVPYLEAVSFDIAEALQEPQVISQRYITSFAEHAALWLTRFLPQHWRSMRFEAWLSSEIGYLTARNIEELRWPIRQNLEHALQTFQRRIEEQLDVVIASIRHSVESAISRQSEREARYGPEIECIERRRQQLEQLLIELAPAENASSQGPL